MDQEKLALELEQLVVAIEAKVAGANANNREEGLAIIATGKAIRDKLYQFGNQYMLEPNYSQTEHQSLLKHIKMLDQYIELLDEEFGVE